MAQPHDAPSAAELVAAVREFIERDVLSTAEGRTRFHALVAANVLGMVERELDLGPAQEAEHRSRLAGLGFADDAELAAALRSGRLDDRSAELKAVLEPSVRAKLAVSNPGYPS